MSEPRLLLASSSPRRRAMLAMAGYDFGVAAPEVDETQLPGEPPEDMVVRLAIAKAETVSAGFPGRLVLGADTTVVQDGEVLGKPRDVEDAAEMLLRIQGRTHTVLTGCALAATGGPTESVVGASRVTMRGVDRAEAEEYARSGEPLDKAGGYALQGAGAEFVASVEGPRSNVIGLPLDLIVPWLDRHGISRAPSVRS